MNSLFSDYVPRLTLYVAAYAKGESEDVLKVLADNTQKAWNESTIQKVADFVRNPRVINGDHFQGLNTVLQLCGRVIPSATSELLKSKWVPGRVKQVLESDRMKVVANVANQVLKTIDLAASCVHVFGTASLIKEARKDNKWNDVKARIATECIEALSSAVEYAETLRRYDVKAGELNFVTEKIRAFMINFRGSLPENSVYYMGKDALKVAAYGVSSLMLESPSLGGTALANAVVSLKQGYSGKYLDDVLSGIMNNLDFYASRSKAPEYLALFNQSLDNLKYQLGSKLDPSYNSANDSNVVRHAISTFRKYQYA
jgi:hypothetical protein